MKIMIIGVVATVLLSIFSVRSFASPAATQNWVRNYVATNSTGGGVSKEWVRDYVTSNSISSASVTGIVVVASYSLAGSSAQAYEIMHSGESNAVQKASNATVNAIYPVIDQIFNTCLEH